MMENNLLYLVLQHRAIILPTERKKRNVYYQFPAWCKYSADFASPLG